MPWSAKLFLVKGDERGKNSELFGLFIRLSKNIFLEKQMIFFFFLFLVLSYKFSINTRELLKKILKIVAKKISPAARFFLLQFHNNLVYLLAAENKFNSYMI